MNLEILLSTKQKIEWDRLPLDVLVEVNEIISRFCPPFKKILGTEHILTVLLL
jgi:hypothetical protein